MPDLRWSAVLGAAALVSTLTLLPVPPASAAPYDGICTGADALTGTTVVVDFQELNGNGGTAAPTLTRCSPNASPGTARTGIKTLQDAGITVAGTQRYGLGFVCRVQGRPSATESIPLAGNPTYKEQCVNTPPAGAYWGYWHADGAGSTWTYSSYGAANRTVVPGGFEGWSFSLNRSASTNPAPRVTPRNPAVTSTAPQVTLSVDDLDRTITRGQSTSLTWTTRNTTTRTASVAPTTGGGSWTGSRAASGTATVTPTAAGTYTYRLAVSGAGGSTAATATLTVNP